MPFALNTNIPMSAQPLRLPDMLGQYGQMQAMLGQAQQQRLNDMHAQLYQAQAQRQALQAQKEEEALRQQAQALEGLKAKYPQYAELFASNPKAVVEALTKQMIPEPAKQTMPAGFEMVDGQWRINPAVAEYQTQERRTKAQEQMQQWLEKLAEQQQARADMMRLAATMRAPAQPPAPSPVTIADPNDPTKAVVIDARTNRIIGAAAPKAMAEKALPVSAAQKLLENQQNLRRAEQALTLIEGGEAGEAKGDKNATGMKGFLPDVILQRVDPGGVATRAAIADLGSLVVHDRSGAAVTAAEYPRLRPFIPSEKDRPETVKKKLQRFVSEYRLIAEEASDFYRESGYKVPAETLKGGGGGTSPTRPSYGSPPPGAVRRKD